ncbi:MAG TPA: carboxypeptidase-like regulatory domain-containing protein, partial [Solirubrobacteraceae bacterium]|nr:carboxypeptidase-like regulatory domain-containing protein [Solirubrobacteraceae bacterium]
MTVVALLVAALAGGSADASSLRRSQAMPAVVGDGTIEGTVTSASTHSAIDGIEVCAYAPEAEPSCTFTNAAGKYAIAIPPGAYVVEFFSPYGSGLNYVTIYQGGASSWEEAEAHPLTVTAGGTDSGVDAAMQEGGHISGHVASAAPPESAIANVEVCAGQVEGEGFGCGLTDASGDYEISALPTGEYLVSFEPPSTGPSFIGQVHEGPVGVTAGATTTGVEARLALGGEIGGKLTAAPSGGPLPGAQACALISETEAVECAPTDEEGDYALRGLPPRSYAVGLAKPGYQWQYYPSGKVFAAAEP